MLLRAPIFYALVVGLLFLGCSSYTPREVDPNERIVVSGDYMSKTYSQKDQTIPLIDLQSSLMKMENTKDAAKKSRFWSYFVPTMAAAGGIIGVTSVLNNNLTTQTRDQQLGVGVGLVGISLMAAYFMQQYLDSAVNSFNSKFPPPAPEESEPETQDESRFFFYMDFVPEISTIAFRPVGGWQRTF